MPTFKKISHEPYHLLNEDEDYRYTVDIHDLSIFLNNYCNRACKHCYVQFEKNPIDLKPEWIQWCIDYFKLQKVIIVGGEPILSPSLPKIIEMLSDSKIRIALSTNSKWIRWSSLDSTIDERWRRKSDGTLKIVEDVLRLLEKVDSIQVSIEGLKEYNDSIRGPGSFDDSMKAVDLLKERNKDVFFRVTYSRENLGMVPDLLRLAAEKDVHIYFFPYKGDDQQPLSSEQQSWLFDNLMAYTSDDGKRLAMAAIPQYICYIGEDDYCPAGKNMINIMSDGMVTPCEMSTPPYHFPLGQFTDSGLDLDRFYERLETYLFEMKQMDMSCLTCRKHRVCQSGCLETNEYLNCPLKQHIDLNYSIFNGDIALSNRQISTRRQAVSKAIRFRKGC